MVTIARYIAIIVLAILSTSCNFDYVLYSSEGEKGNGNVITETRDVNGSFTTIRASEGIDVYITQEQTAKIVVEADENIAALIGTDIENGVLKIHAIKNIGRTKSKKVHVSVPNLTKIKASSGADIRSTMMLTAEDLEVETSSGADIKVDVKAGSVSCKSSSGSDIKIFGTAESLAADASSGSDINARELIAKNCNASVSSGADIVVYASEKLVAHSSSGGDISYYGDPASVSKNNSVSGSVHKK